MSASISCSNCSSSGSDGSVTASSVGSTSDSVIGSGRLVLVDDLRVDDVVVARRRRARTGPRVLLVVAVSGGRLLVELLRERLAGGHEPLRRALDRLDVGAGERAPLNRRARPRPRPLRA